MLAVVTQGQAGAELAGGLPVDRAEPGIDVGLELVGQQQRGGIGRRGRVVELLDHALPGVGAKADAHGAIDVEVIAAELPRKRAVGGRRQPHFEARVLLVADLVLDAVASRRAVRAEGRSGGRREDERYRHRADRAGLVDREALERGGGGEAAVDRQLPRRVGCADIAREIGRGAIGHQVLLDVRIKPPRGQLHRAEIVIDLGRNVEAGLVVGGAHVAVEVERVGVDVFVERRVHAREVGQRERRVERQRGAVEFRIARLDVQLRGAVHAEHQPPVDRPGAVIVDHLAVVQEDVLVEPVAGVRRARKHEPGAFAERAGQVRRHPDRALLSIRCLDRAGQRFGGLERLDHDRAGGGVAAVDRALGSFEDFDLAQRALVLVELRGVGLENAVDHQRNRAFGIARAVHAANVDLGVAGLRCAGHDGDAGGERHEVLGLGGAGAFERGGGQHRDRGGHILQPLVLPARGDDDRGFVIGLGRVRSLGEGRS